MASTLSKKDEEYKPPPRQALHENKDIREFVLRTVTSKVPLEIGLSGIADMGSGLFVRDKVGDGEDIFCAKPLILCVDPRQTSVCHHCLRDGKSLVHSGGPTRDPSDGALDIKSCMGCKVARFCSRECQKRAWAKYHKDECDILRDNARLPPRHLALFRVLLWQERKLISTEYAQALEYLESHFVDYTNDERRSSDIMTSANFIKDATKSKTRLAIAWKLLPTVSNSPWPKGSEIAKF